MPQVNAAGAHVLQVLTVTQVTIGVASVNTSEARFSVFRIMTAQILEKEHKIGGGLTLAFSLVFFALVRISTRSKCGKL